MKKLLVVAGVLTAATMLLTVGAVGAVTKGKSRPLKTEQLMAGLVRPNCAAIGKGLKATPADDKAWEELAMQAALLNEASYILMADGRCPDGVWKGACDTLREQSAAVLAAIEAKDADAANGAFKNMTGACAACHKAHKK